MRRRVVVELRMVLRRAARLVSWQGLKKRPPALQIATVTVVMLAAALASVLFDLAMSGGEFLRFNEYGLTAILASWALLTLGIWTIGPRPTRRLGWALCDIAVASAVGHILAASAALWFVFSGHFDEEGIGSENLVWYWVLVCLFALTMLLVWRGGRSLWLGEGKFPGLRLLAVALLPVAVIPSQPLITGYYSDWSRTDAWELARNGLDLFATDVDDESAHADRGSDMEDTLYRQAGLLAGTLGAIMPNDAAKPEYFFLAAAPNGWQDVFASEVTKAKAIFDERFGTRGHSVVLITSSETRETVPLANTKNIEVALQEIGKLMDRDNDVLVLYITSHGNVGTVSVYLEGHTLNQITPDSLAKALDDARIINRVLIISACHSGSFIPRLANPDTLIMTAARTDRTSFGCANGREWTYFGDALFNNALREEKDFVKAFGKAKALIEKWEFWRVLLLQGRSEPQISVGSEIAKVLARMPSGENQQAKAFIEELRK